MIYKKFELSLSLNGNKIVHIARSAAGNVVFRESTEEKLIKAIDDSLKPKEKVTEAVNEERSQKEDGVHETLIPAPQKRVTRGPDGKFIGKSQLEQAEIKKKTFWDKLTG